MARLEHLTFTNELKTDLLNELAKSGGVKLQVVYDKAFDSITIRFVPDKVGVVHYIDNDVALLYEPDNKQIVGMQIDDFATDFLPRHAALQKVWKLSESDARIESLGDLGDLMIRMEHRKSEAAKEIVKATEDLLENEGVELTPVLC